MVSIVCAHCGASFDRPLKFYNLNVKRKCASYCGRECKNKSRKTLVSVECLVCKKPVERRPDQIAKSKSGVSFCSSSCSATHWNTIARREQAHPNFLGGEASYRAICFRYHEKECVVCKEKLVIDVHHFDGNRQNNEPSNLIPLCPSHHRYWHSPHRNLIEQQVTEYREVFIEQHSEADEYEDRELWEE